MDSINFQRAFGMNVKEMQAMRQKNLSGANQTAAKTSSDVKLDDSVFTVKSSKNIFSSNKTGASNSNMTLGQLNSAISKNQVQHSKIVPGKSRASDMWNSMNKQALASQSAQNNSSGGMGFVEGLTSVANSIRGLQNAFKKEEPAKAENKAEDTASKTKNAVDNAKDKDSANKAVEQGKTDKKGVENNAKKDENAVKKASSETNNAKANETQADKNLNASKEQQTSANEKLGEANQNQTQANANLETAKSNVASAEAELNSANAAATKDNPNTAAINAAKQKLEAARQEQAKAEEELNKANEQQKTADANANDAAGQVEQASADKTAAQTAAQKAQQTETQAKQTVAADNKALDNMNKSISTGEQKVKTMEQQVNNQQKADVNNNQSNSANQLSGTSSSGSTLSTSQDDDRFHSKTQDDMINKGNYTPEERAAIMQDKNAIRNMKPGDTIKGSGGVTYTMNSDGSVSTKSSAGYDMQKYSKDDIEAAAVNNADNRMREISNRKRMDKEAGLL